MSFYGESHPIKVTFTPAGSKGYIEWTSSNPEVVSVDENGNVKAIGKVNGVGRATITATLKGTQVSQTCIARCSFEAPARRGTRRGPQHRTLRRWDHILQRQAQLQRLYHACRNHGSDECLGRYRDPGLVYRQHRRGHRQRDRTGHHGGQGQHHPDLYHQRPDPHLCGPLLWLRWDAKGQSIENSRTAAGLPPRSCCFTRK